MKKEKEKDKDKEKKKKRVKKTARSQQRNQQKSQQKEMPSERPRRTRQYTSSSLKKSRREKESVLQAQAQEQGQTALPPEPLEYFLQAVGGKWKMRILWALREEGSLRYRLIRNKVAGITDMMLSQSLRELTECGLTIRRQFQEIPPRVEYEITEAGRALLPIFEKLLEWEEQFRSALEEQRLAASEASENGNAVDM